MQIDDDPLKNATEIRRLKIHEISAVDRPATRRKFLVIKRENVPDERSTSMQTPQDFDTMTGQRDEVVKLFRTAAPSRADINTLVRKMANSYQKADSSLSRVEAEVKAYEVHPELYVADLAAEARGEAVPVDAPIEAEPGPLQKAQNDLESEFEKKVDQLFKASGAPSRAAAWGVVYANEPDLVERLNRAQELRILGGE